MSETAPLALAKTDGDAESDGARARVVAAARQWIGTPYHPCADLEGVGVDCGMLLVRVFVDLGLVEPFDPRPYPWDWHLHRSAERYLAHVAAHARLIDPPPQPGDLVIFRQGRCYSHGGVVTRADPLTIVHAYAPYRRVIEEAVGHNAALAKALPSAKFASHFGRTAPAPGV